MRIRPRGLALAVALLAAAAAIGVASAEDELPKNDGWVTDLARLLTPQQEQSLETSMESYKAGSGNEIALLTVPGLGGRSLERYALEVARAWGIGEKGSNNGALLLVAKQERKIRIEVGRGLEGNLTDSISGRIIRNVMGPLLKEGRTYEGLRAGVEAMHAAAGGDYARIPEDRGRHSKRSSGIGIIPLLIVIFLVSRLFGNRGGPRGGGGGSGILPWLLLGSLSSRGRHSSGWSGGFSGGGGFGGFGGGGGFSGGGASGGW